MYRKESPGVPPGAARCTARSRQVDRQEPPGVPPGTARCTAGCRQVCCQVSPSAARCSDHNHAATNANPNEGLRFNHGPTTGHPKRLWFKMSARSNE